MFVRWRQRRLKRKPGVVYYADLIQSRRLNGQPRQAVVCYLAHIKEIFLHATAHQAWFWKRIDQKLDHLGLDPKTRQAIETALLRRVPRPTEAELKALQELRTRLRGGSRPHGRSEDV